MKIKKYKRFGVSITKYTKKLKKYKFVGEIFDDESGCYDMFYDGIQLHCGDDGTIKDWIKDAADKIKELTLLKKFLQDVLHKQKKS